MDAMANRDYSDTMKRRPERGDVLWSSNREIIRERLLPGFKNRILQVLARIAPGATTLPRVCDQSDSGHQWKIM
jgi:hypothetical protein